MSYFFFFLVLPSKSSEPIKVLCMKLSELQISDLLMLGSPVQQHNMLFYVPVLCSGKPLPCWGSVLLHTGEETIYVNDHFQQNCPKSRILEHILISSPRGVQLYLNKQLVHLFYTWVGKNCQEEEPCSAFAKGGALVLGQKLKSHVSSSCQTEVIYFK